MWQEVITLTLAVIVNGDQMSMVNIVGLVLCLSGIVVHVVLKATASRECQLSLVWPLLVQNWHLSWALAQWKFVVNWAAGDLRYLHLSSSPRLAVATAIIIRLLDIRPPLPVGLLWYETVNSKKLVPVDPVSVFVPVCSTVYVHSWHQFGIFKLFFHQIFTMYVTCSSFLGFIVDGSCAHCTRFLVCINRVLT